jgi:hypothetical protein
MDGDRPAAAMQPTQYVCPSCRLHLLTWTAHLRHVELFHKVALWADFWTGDVRLICQYCLGATEILPEALVELLRDRYGLQIPRTGPTPREPRRD